MVLVILGMHLDFDHVRDQEIPSLENLITRHLRVPSSKIKVNSVGMMQTCALVYNRGG